VLAAIKRILTLRCDESARLVSQSLDRDLSPSERWAVRLHAMICRSCRRYKKQLALIREAWQRYSDPSHISESVPAGLSADARLRLNQALAEQDESDS